MWLQIWWEEGATLHLSITNMAQENITYVYSATRHLSLGTIVTMQLKSQVTEEYQQQKHIGKEIRVGKNV